ncbi:MAG: hypothetical protein GY898_16170 [Proteobacteria bacterium]|nr:hypothetical protein [Pseudomonadota bacterium]
MKRALILGVALTAGAGSAQAETFRVPEQFAEIQDALDVAAPCDIVEVGAGDYDGPVYISLGVTLITTEGASIDAGGVDKNGGPIDAVATVTNGSHIEGFELHNARNGVAIVGNWSVAKGNQIHDVEVGIKVEGATGYAVGNTVTGVEKGVEANGATLWLDENVFVSNGTGVELFQSEFRMLGNRVEDSGRGYLLRQSWGPVTSCELVGNDIGLVVSGGDLRIEDCTIDGNLVGAQVLEGEPLLLDNSFTDNDFGITTMLSSPRLIGNRIDGSEYIGIAADLGSSPRIANNLLTDNADGIDAVLSEPVVVNNTVSGGERSVVVRSAEATVVNNLLVDAAVLALDAADGPDLIAGFNLFFGNAADMDGYTSDGTDLFEDPDLDVDFVPGVDSPAVDGGNTAAAYEDPDGTLSDIGYTGGPEADDAYEEIPGGPPTQGEQFDYEFAEGEQGVVFVQNILDPRNDPLEYRWDTNPADGLQYCDGYANAADFTPPDEGDYVIGVLAIDSEGYELEAEVNVHAYNLPPEASIDLLDGFAEGTESQFYVDAFDQGPEDVVLLDIDIDGDTEYELTDVEPGFVSWTPPQSGSVTLLVRAFDEDGGEVLVEQPVFVENLPPFLSEGPPDEIFVGTAMAYTLQVDDPSEQDTVTAELSNGPEGLTLDDLRLLWEPTAADVGQNPYDITLTDSDGDQAVYFLRVGVFQEGTGCGCATAEPKATGWGLLLLLAVATRRRRRLWAESRGGRGSCAWGRGGGKARPGAYLQ